MSGSSWEIPARIRSVASFTLVIIALGLVSRGCAGEKSDVLYSCTFNYWPLPFSETRISLQYLAPRAGPTEVDCKEFCSHELKTLTPLASLKELTRSSLDPNLPFIFFTNGFNQQEPFKSSWMYKVAGVMSRFGVDRMDSLPKANIVFISWHIRNLFANSTIAMVPIYYRTLANYEFIMSQLAYNIMHLIDYIDYARDITINPSPEDDVAYYSRFEFYGHSLGAHLMADAVFKVHSSRGGAKFGKLIGLDPAVPCFSRSSHGIAAAKTASTVAQVKIVHSNAAILGVPADRGQVEVVLNGGTFQPGCGWYDLDCHHVRSTEVFEYSDDTCQMVAYRCNKYEQFKIGACETCEGASNSSFSVASGGSGCLLVNLPAQYVAEGGIEPPSEGDSPIRQLIDQKVAGTRTPMADSQFLDIKKRPGHDKMDSSMKSLYYYVNTSPNFASSPETHCLQHYQLRLLVLNHPPQECGGSFRRKSDGKFQLKLSPRETNREKLELSDQELKKFTLSLTNTIDGKLQTGLLNFEGRPTVFDGATIANIDFKSWAQCLAENNVTNSVEFILDIAFMSNINRNVRRFYSTVLCGRWHPGESNSQDHYELEMSLCRQIELMNVSSKIDEFLNPIGFEHQYDTWQVSLLDSLFSLFLEWEPLRNDHS